MRCGLCGLEYDEEQAACGGCVLVSDCGRVRCPRCGYEDMRPSALERWWRRRRGRQGGGSQAGNHSQPCRADTLAAQQPGDRYVVVGMTEAEVEPVWSKRLMAVGLIPGARLELLRRWPAYVFRIGNSQYAVDAELASQIRVRALEPGEGEDVQPHEGVGEGAGGAPRSRRRTS